jgi:nucleoside-diphosphate-sugar epimerase
MEKNAKIFVTGHRGMVGSAIVRRLQSGGYTNIVTRTHAEVDLLDQRAVHAFLAAEAPDYVYVAAARVGGVRANNLCRARAEANQRALRHRQDRRHQALRELQPPVRPPVHERGFTS